MKLNPNPLLRSCFGIVKAFAIPAVIYLALTVIIPDKIYLSNIKYLLIQAVMPAILAWGASFNLTAGHSDFPSAHPCCWRPL